MPIGSIAFFTRLLGGLPAKQRYADATIEIVEAERLGYARAWVAQHHLSGDEGGLPSPLPFLAHVAAHTQRIGLATGVLTLGLEDPLRAAEDAAVVSILSGDRLDLGIGPGGSAAAHTAWGISADERSAAFERNARRFREALVGTALTFGGDVLYPSAPGLARRIWRATFSVRGGRLAGEAGDGLLLSRTQARTDEHPRAALSDIQVPIVDEYLAGLAPGSAPRILASRTVFVADDGDVARHRAAEGITRVRAQFEANGARFESDSAADLIRATDAHVGTPDEVAESLTADETLRHATELAIQVHSVDPPHAEVLESLRLFATRVAPQVGVPKLASLEGAT